MVEDRYKQLQVKEKSDYQLLNKNIFYLDIESGEKLVNGVVKH
jgi:hypothetical protein